MRQSRSFWEHFGLLICGEVIFSKRRLPRITFLNIINKSIQLRISFPVRRANRITNTLLLDWQDWPLIFLLILIGLRTWRFLLADDAFALWAFVPIQIRRVRNLLRQAQIRLVMADLRSIQRACPLVIDQHQLIRRRLGEAVINSLSTLAHFDAGLHVFVVIWTDLLLFCLDDLVERWLFWTLL